ncbi:MarR family winged helix-turn-helix transcriptional regulator [Bifidobacterium choerinum]|uniref:MarR-type transcriptional regulator n=1 Tax=Bifidobacterium choerinum TaxID=35760 RepID=A0A087AC70_9BIFI|nr:MarR family winged helix-turn-helix transcriptional regulator [Bifidobacterium choerinum]KFI56370.1 MarR-type transcriptional regulator [Bifidobacterium choerinum]
MVIGNADGGHGQEWLKPSLEIRAVHQLIARYWNVVTPSESTGSGTNMPIILYLHDHRHEDVFQYDIERAFSITRSTASRVLALMEKKGLITRTSVQWDARVRKIELTAAADGIVEELQRRSRQLERTLFEGFSDDEQRRFLADLERMQSNLYATGLLGKETPGCACAHPPADEEQHGDGARAPADASPTRPQQSADTDTTDAADAAYTTNTTNNDPDDADGPNKPSDSSEAHRFQPEKAKKGAEQ